MVPIAPIVPIRSAQFVHCAPQPRGCADAFLGDPRRRGGILARTPSVSVVDWLAAAPATAASLEAGRRHSRRALAHQGLKRTERKTLTTSSRSRRVCREMKDAVIATGHKDESCVRLMCWKRVRKRWSGHAGPQPFDVESGPKLPWVIIAFTQFNLSLRNLTPPGVADRRSAVARPRDREVVPGTTISRQQSVVAQGRL